MVGDLEGASDSMAELEVEEVEEPVDGRMESVEGGR